MNPEPMRLSDAEYFFKLCNLVASSYPVLRKVFQTRWKKLYGAAWEDVEVEDREKAFVSITGLCHQAYKIAGRIQKRVLVTGCLEDWDVTLISLVIQNLGDGNSHKKENCYVRRLRELRNYLEHHSTHKVTELDYMERVETYKRCLLELGVKSEVIDQIIIDAGVSSSDEAFKMVRKLYGKARKNIKKNNFDTALRRCEEAIGMPSLLQNQLAAAHEYRAECYLQCAILKRKNQQRQESEGYLDQAIKDGKRALELNEYSWKAHYMIGRCHRIRNELELAINHHTKAFAISPVQTEVKTELDSCKFDFEVQSSTQFTDPMFLPMTDREKVAEAEKNIDLGKLGPYSAIMQKKFQKHLANKEEYSECQSYFDTDGLPGEGDFYRGFKYLSGWGVPHDDAEAVRYFTKAKDAGIPHGFYKLGECYMLGVGVEKNPGEAYKLYLKAAQMSENTGNLVNLQWKCEGVANAQFGLGSMYENGIVVEQDYVEAAKWYRKSAENGNQCAAVNLGNMYLNGEGVEYNEKLALMYFQKGLMFGYSYAAKDLIGFYKNHLEPEKALAMFHAAKQMGHPEVMKQNVAELMAELEPLALKRDFAKIFLLRHEREFKLDTKGLTFKERLLQQNDALLKDATNVPILVKQKRLAGKKVRELKLEASLKGIEVAKKDDLNLALIRSKAREGSAIAARILKTRNISHDLIQFVQAKEIFSDKQKSHILKLLYDCTTLEFRIIRFDDSTTHKLQQVIEELFNANRGKKDVTEMKIRFVHVKLNYKASSSGQGSSAPDLLKQGIRMYPENPHYYILYCAHEKDPQPGLEYVEEGLKKFPDNVDLLYFKALFLRSSLLEFDPSFVEGNDAPHQKKVVIAAYKKFLKMAAKDHSSVPNAYYAVAMINLMISTDTKQMEEYYKLGKDAESNAVLPSGFADNRNCDDRLFVEAFFSVSGGGGSDVAIDIPMPGILIRKMYLNSPVRRWLIILHRKIISTISKGRAMLCFCSFSHLIRTPTQIPPERMCLVTPITIREMNPGEMHVYQDRVLDLTVIDVPNKECACPAIHLIVEDEDGDVLPLNLFNMKLQMDNFEWEVGVKLALLSPTIYPLKYGYVSMFGLFSDDPHLIVYLGKVENLCRFCGEPVQIQKILKCCKCLKAVYCSKDCQVHDWTIMKHKLICYHNK